MAGDFSLLGLLRGGNFARIADMRNIFCGQGIFRLAELFAGDYIRPMSNEPRYIPPPGTNQTPPADELFDVRSAIKTLEEREKVLRELILTDKSARTGNRYLASVRIVESTRVDVKELRAMYPEEVAAFTFPTKSTKVELFAIDDETGELTRPKRTKESTTP